MAATLKRLRQDINFAAARAIGITVVGGAGGLAQIVGEAGQIAAVGVNSSNGAYGAALAGIAYGHSTFAVARKTLHRDGPRGLNAHIHTRTLKGNIGAWQGGLPDA